MTAAWKKVLFNQFHDVMAGSGIHPVYVDATRDHEEVRRIGNEALAGALAELADRADTSGEGVPVVIFNPLNWTRTEGVEVEVQFPKPVTGIEVIGAGGKPAFAEIVAQDAATHRVRVRFVAEEVPGIGFLVFRLFPAASGLRRLASPLVARGDTLENEFVRVRVDQKTGCIVSLFEKLHQRELIAPSGCGNLLQAFVDKPKEWDAWNIDADFENQKWDLLDAQEVKLIESGPVRAVIRVVKKFQSSTFTQDITLYAGVARVDVRMSADWHERHILLKVAFPVAVESDFATFEIPYGTIQRPTTRRTPDERAQFEVPALRWADISNEREGLSLLNDSKYGYDAKGNVLRLSLLRSPVWPDPEADQGLHEFTYSLYPHALFWGDADTMHQGYELNTPLLAVVTTAHPGSLGPSHFFAGLAEDNLALTAIKEAEDGAGLIFRFYEFAGKKADAHLQLPPGATQAWETNLMEVVQRELPLQNSEVDLPVGPYEIKTIKVKFAPAASGDSSPHSSQK